METVQDYRHTEAWGSKEFQTNIPLVSYVQTLRKNDTEQNSTNHRTAPVSELVGHAQANC